jgi:hypothetical protein
MFKEVRNKHKEKSLVSYHVGVLEREGFVRFSHERPIPMERRRHPDEGASQMTEVFYALADYR